MNWNHTACTHISVRHRHALKKHIYTCIFGITCSLVAGLVGCQKHSSSHLTSELLFQKHSPAGHNMPSSISSHLFPSSMGLYGPFSSHKTAFVRHAAFLLFFALKVFDVCTFPLDWMQSLQAKQLLTWAGFTGPPLFCILCNSVWQLKKADGGRKILGRNKSTGSETAAVKSRCCSPWNKCLRSLSAPLPCHPPQWTRLMLGQWETAAGCWSRLRPGGEDAQRTHNTVSQKASILLTMTLNRLYLPSLATPAPWCSQPLNCTTCSSVSL